ncbi:MAG: hypothetical protein P8Y85_01615 [Nitrospirota bacterium]
MDKRWIALVAVVLGVAFGVGFRSSYVSGIQPGYFEKQEAPAYGVGGGEGFAAGMSKDVQEHFKTLYEDLQ